MRITMPQNEGFLGRFEGSRHVIGGFTNRCTI